MFAAILIVCGTTTTLTSYGKEDEVTQVSEEYFKTWNKCETLTALKEYVEDVTNPMSSNFIKEEDRIATFDMDGTFVGELVADDDARDHADLAEGARREAKWREAGYHIISMKNDFLTIYGPEVEKVDFTFPAE
jgi:hypothetical protein